MRKVNPSLTAAFFAGALFLFITGPSTAAGSVVEYNLTLPKRMSISQAVRSGP